MSGFSPRQDHWQNQGNFEGYENFNLDATSGSVPFEQSFYDYNRLENPADDVTTPGNYWGSTSFYGGDSFKPSGENDYDDEPPLLEELGIDPDRIMEKTLAVLNPFHKRGLVDDADFLRKDADLAGPLAFCLALAATLLVSGGKANFGYVYGLAVTGCLLMYFLLSLININGVVTVASVASILGYCLLPMVLLSVLSVFLTLTSLFGIVVCILIVSWCSLSASRLFVTLMATDFSQRPLIAYPCFLLYGVFALIVTF